MGGAAKGLAEILLAAALMLCGGPDAGRAPEVAGRARAEAEMSLRPLVKSEVAGLLGVTTRTVDRYVRRGLLHAGRKRRGHKTLYWLLGDVGGCLSALEEDKKKDKT